MTGETPRGGTVETCCGESVETELFCTSMDIVCDLLKGSKVLDVGDLIACLLEQSLVYDDAECLVAVACCKQFAVFTVKVEIIGGHFLVEIGLGEVIAELAPSLDCACVTALEEGRRILLVHLCGEDIVVGAGCCGDDLNVDTGQFGILLCKCLPCGICFGLEVQVIYAAFFIGLCAAGEADDHGKRKYYCQNKSKILFHCDSSFSIFYFHA